MTRRASSTSPASVFDPVLGTRHLGILDLSQTWAATWRFLSEHRHGDD